MPAFRRRFTAPRHVRRLTARAIVRAETFADLSDAQLADRYRAAAYDAADSPAVDGDWPVEALAVAIAASARTTGLTPFPVQVLAAAAAAYGSVVEMQTGEGKTLATLLAACVLAAPGRGVHVVTANDYLAGRDAAFAEPLAALLGLSVGRSRTGAHAAERQRAHAASITFGTVASFGFEHLSDQVVFTASDLACREPFAALVDEADAVLLDQAMVPLQLSAPDNGRRFADLGPLTALAGQLVEGVDVHVDRAASAVALTDQGVAHVEEALGLNTASASDTAGADASTAGSGLYARPELVQLLTSALSARFLFDEGADFLVERPAGADDSVRPTLVLLDRATGRRRPGATLRADLQRALELRTGCTVSPMSKVAQSMTVQAFFARYRILGGMTGTATAAADELAEHYAVTVVQVPTNRPCVRTDLADRIYASGAERDDVLCAEVVARATTGQPVLVVAETVDDVERLGSRLAAQAGDQVTVRVLSARSPAGEADVFASAGLPSTVTVATPMAGRGVDIVLGAGDVSARDQVIAAGGLAVFGAARFAHRRLDAQLRGRAGRQGDPGVSQFFLSFDDDLPRRFAPRQLAALLGSSGELPARLAAPVFTRAQEAVTGEQAAARRSLVAADRILAGQRDAVYAFRRMLLDMPAWVRVRAALDAVLEDLERRDKGRTKRGDEDRAALIDRLWPTAVPIVAEDGVAAAPGTVPAGELAERMTGHLRSNLAPLTELPETERGDLVDRTVGTLVLDCLDAQWAAHLERAAARHADAGLLSLTGQQPGRVVSKWLAGSFDALWVDYAALLLANLAGLRISSITAAGDPPGNPDAA